MRTTMPRTMRGERRAVETNANNDNEIRLNNGVSQSRLVHPGGCTPVVGMGYPPLEIHGPPEASIHEIYFNSPNSNNLSAR